MNKELTFGEKAVGINFNPGGNPVVDNIKKLYAQIIDEMNAIKVPGEQGRLASIAITEAQGAQMWAVKAITWKEELPTEMDALADNVGA